MGDFSYKEHGPHDYASKGVAGSGLGLGIACLSNAVSGITKTIVPASAICPEPMPRYNNFVVPPATPAA